MSKNLPRQQEQEKKEESKEQSKENFLPAYGKLTQISVRTAPIPPPEELEGYKKIDPSFPERIIRMAEKEQKFRHHSYYLGQFFAFIIALAALGSATYLGINGKEWLGGSIGLGALASIVGAYFYSQHQKSGKK
jgi:uncharacterized membrane protein